MPSYTNLEQWKYKEKFSLYHLCTSTQTQLKIIHKLSESFDILCGTERGQARNYSKCTLNMYIKNTLPLRDKLGYIYCDLSRRLVATIISLVKSGSAIGVALIWDIKLLMMRHTFSLIVIYTQPSVLTSSQHLTSHHTAKILSYQQLNVTQESLKDHLMNLLSPHFNSQEPTESEININQFKQHHSEHNLRIHTPEYVSLLHIRASVCTFIFRCLDKMEIP